MYIYLHILNLSFQIQIIYRIVFLPYTFCRSFNQSNRIFCYPVLERFFLIKL